jgi:3-oxoacyl-[acyl-carrier-protein] synthase-1
VVTGCGVVCALGNCVAEFAAALRAGRSGVRLVASDPTGPAAVAASPHLGPVSELPATERALFDPVTRYAVHAATEALEQSGLLREREVVQANAGVYVGTAMGGMYTVEEAYRDGITAPRPSRSPSCARWRMRRRRTCRSVSA